MRRSVPNLFALIAVAGVIAGCSLFTRLPEPVGIRQRIAELKTDDLDVERPVEIRWNEHMVPWITAESDADAAFALGYVHAHLRLAQMEILRRMASGRLAEVAGPLAADIDETVRILGFYRGGEEGYERLPAETRLWVDRYVDGINAYIARLERLPHEFRLFAFRPEPWKPVDVMAFGRLAGADVNWLTSMGLLSLTGREDWETIWRQAMDFNGGAIPSVAAGAAGETDGVRRLAALLEMVGAATRSGSNAWAVGGARSASGKPVLATDPHLGITAPNIWLLAGLKSPGYEVVGMMPAGLPIFGLGRTPYLAWGATNLRARSSDLVDVSDLPARAFRVERETIGIRFGFDREITRRISPFGPLITDSPLIEDGRERKIALRWIGHLPSDELTAYLKGVQARSVEAFREAFRDYAVPGLAFVLAAADGDIAIGTAARLPAYPFDAPRQLVSPPPPGQDPWERLYDPTELPWIVNPAKGYVASANNPTAEAVVPMTLYDTPPDRISVLEEALSKAEGVDRAFMAALQRNAMSPSALVLRDAIVALARRVDRLSALPEGLVAWDGDYATSSKGAVAFEGFVAALAPRVYEALDQDDVYEVMQRWSWFRVKLAADLERLADEKARRLLEEAGAAAREAGDEFATWGEMHRLQLKHALAQAPVIGDRYIFADIAAGGSNETVMKTAHTPSGERHAAFYGSQARQISDMADPDANWFVLLGGQDGWLNAEGFRSQMPLWQSGDYIRLPLRRPTVEAEFRNVTVLRPKE